MPWAACGPPLRGASGLWARVVPLSGTDLHRGPVDVDADLSPAAASIRLRRIVGQQVAVPQRECDGFGRILDAIDFSRVVVLEPFEDLSPGAGLVGQVEQRPRIEVRLA